MLNLCFSINLFHVCMMNQFFFAKNSKINVHVTKYCVVTIFINKKPSE